MSAGRQLYQPLSDAIPPFRAPSPAGSRSTPSGRSSDPTNESSKRKRDDKKDSSPSSSSLSAGVSPYTTPRTNKRLFIPPSLSRMPSPPNSHDRALFEFQWRVLHLCREFYEAASELLQGTPESVISRCYLDDNINTTNPLTLLNEARRACDHLLNNPSSSILGTNAPTTARSPPHSPRNAAVSASYATSPLLYEYFRPASSSNSTSPTMLPNAAMTGPSPYSLRPVSAAAGAPSRSPSLSQLHINQQQGSWSETETDKLQALARESTAPNGEVDWDSVVAKFGVGRSRHQILIRATQLGLKPTPTRPSRQRQQAQHIRAQAAAAQASASASLTSAPLPAYQHHSLTAQSPVSATTATGLPWTSPHHTPYYPLPPTFPPQQEQQQQHVTPKSETANPFVWPPPPGPPPGSGDGNEGGAGGFGYG